MIIYVDLEIKDDIKSLLSPHTLHIYSFISHDILFYIKKMTIYVHKKDKGSIGTRWKQDGKGGGGSEVNPSIFKKSADKTLCCPLEK